MPSLELGTITRTNPVVSLSPSVMTEQITIDEELDLEQDNKNDGEAVSPVVDVKVDESSSQPEVNSMSESENDNKTSNMSEVSEDNDSDDSNSD